MKGSPLLCFPAARQKKKAAQRGRIARQKAQGERKLLPAEVKALSPPSQGGKEVRAGIRAWKDGMYFKQKITLPFLSYEREGGNIFAI